MFGHKSGCGHWGKGHGMKGDKDWEADYEKMNPKEKKEMLMKKKEHLKEKMDWVEEQLGKLDK